jgi:hypothetical protein
MGRGDDGRCPFRVRLGLSADTARDRVAERSVGWPQDAHRGDDRLVGSHGSDGHATHAALHGSGARSRWRVRISVWTGSGGGHYRLLSTPSDWPRLEHLRFGHCSRTLTGRAVGNLYPSRLTGGEWSSSALGQ